MVVVEEDTNDKKRQRLRFYASKLYALRIARELRINVKSETKFHRSAVERDSLQKQKKTITYR
jgi:hypothetical protein